MYVFIFPCFDRKVMVFLPKQFLYVLNSEKNTQLWNVFVWQGNTVNKIEFASAGFDVIHIFNAKTSSPYKTLWWFFFLQEQNITWTSKNEQAAVYLATLVTGVLRLSINNSANSAKFTICLHLG